MRDELLIKQLWDMVRLISVNFETAYRPVVEIHGLTTLQCRILLAVKEWEETTVGNISKIIDASSSNVSNMCKKLELEGFVNRIRSIEDERIVLVQLTDKGKEILLQIQSDLKNIYRPILKNLTEKEFETIISGMKLINNLLEEFQEASKKVK
ncbi:MAG: MarR family transcriptional regulator [Tissierellia bacterium]|nr:MarR family transcriptional regulator [Tissierellia bacterium]